jgi:photosystem II stability/assembly factor-like uncharacterized protein
MKLRFGLALALLTIVAPSPAEVLAPQPYVYESIPWGGGGYVPGFAYHPKAKDILYTRTDIGGLYRYDFAAHKWIALTDHIGWDDSDLMGVISIALDPNDPNKVYTANGLYLGDWGRKGAILRSNDRGLTWQRAELPIRIGGNADGRGTGERLVVDPNDGNVLYYGSNKDGLWKSTDGGKSFASAGSPATSISLVAIDPKTHDIYLGDAAGRLLVAKRGDGGFVPVEGTPTMVPQHAVFAPDGSLYVTFAAGSSSQAVNPSFAERGGVWKRDPSGAWHEITPVKPGEAKFGYSGVDVGPDGTLVVSTLDRWHPHDEIFISRDGGAHWSTLSDKSRLDSAAYPWVQSVEKMNGRVGHWISDVRINPFNKDEMIYGTGAGIWTSRNLSAAGPVEIFFNVANLEETATLALVSPPSGPAVMAAFGDVGGAAWIDPAKSPFTGLFAPTNESNRSLDYAGLKPSILARTADRSPTHGFLSFDAGLTWAPIASTPYKEPHGGDWRGPGTIAVSAKGTALVWAPEKDAAYFSKDNGATWTLSAGWPSGRDAALVPVADKGIDGVFYVFDRQTGSVLISVDAGASFKAVASGLPPSQSWEWAQFAVVPGRIRDLWLALPYGLIHSRDSSTPFANLKDVQRAAAVGFGAPKEAGGYPAVYLSGRVKGIDGLWRSDDEGASWTRINDDAHAFGRVMQISGDRRHYGVVYIAPGGRGILKGEPAK